MSLRVQIQIKYIDSWHPIVGSDGLTYLNPAMVKCKNTLQPKKREKWKTLFYNILTKIMFN